MKIKLTVREVLSYSFFFLVSTMYAFRNTRLEFSGLLNTSIVTLVTLIFLFWFILGKYNWKFTLVFISLILLSMINYYFTGNTWLLILCLAVFFSSSISMRQLLKFLFVYRSILLISIIIFSLVGLLPLNIIDLSKAGKQVTGFAMGFNHPNQLAYNVGLLMFLYIAYNHNKLSWFHLSVFNLIGMITFVLSQSRSLLVSILFLDIIVFFLKRNFYKGIFGKIMDVICQMLTLIIPLIGIVFPYMLTRTSGYFKVFLYKINDVFSSRFTHSGRLLDNYPLSLWGNELDLSILDRLYGYSVIDNGLVKMLYTFGIVGFAIYVLMSYFTVRKLLKLGYNLYAYIIVVFLLWGLSEDILTNFAINFTVIFWAVMIDTDLDKEGTNGKFE